MALGIYESAPFNAIDSLHMFDSENVLSRSRWVLLFVLTTSHALPAALIHYRSLSNNISNPEICSTIESLNLQTATDRKSLLCAPSAPPSISFKSEE